MRIYRRQTVEELRLKREKARLTYERCTQLLPHGKKSKRKYRTLTQCSRLYRHENGQSYEVKLTNWRTVNGVKAVYDPPIITIHPHNVAVLNSEVKCPVGPMSIHNLFYKFFGMYCESRSNKRSSVRFWWCDRGEASSGEPQASEAASRADRCLGQARQHVHQNAR